MIITIGNTKGGSGKSTLAVNIAIHRAATGPVLLVDGDDQQSALSFTEFRNDYTAIALTGPLIRSQTPKLAANYVDTIIDVGGRDTAAFRAALTVSDRILIPVQPRTFDVWAMEAVAELVREARHWNPDMIAFTVLNLADVQGRENQEAAEALREFEPGIRYLDTPIMRRKAYSDGIAQGKGVGEVKPRNSKAIAELSQVIALVCRGDIQ